MSNNERSLYAEWLETDRKTPFIVWVDKRSKALASFVKLNNVTNKL